MRTYQRTFIVLLSLMVVGAALPLAAGLSPKITLEQNVAKAIAILNDPQYQQAPHEQLKELKAVLYQICDFREFSRLVLAGSWDAFTPGQQDQFTHYFAEFLSNFYMQRLQERYQDEKVQFLDESMLSPSRALINARVRTKMVEVDAQVWMLNGAEGWRFYNLGAYGVSAVLFYRAQFTALLLKDTPEELILRLKKRVNEQQQRQQQARKQLGAFRGHALGSSAGSARP